MNNFFLMTRGRTGSTVVIDELNKSHGLCAVQELFLIYDFDNISDVSEIAKVYDVIMPFVIWKRKDWAQKWIPHFFYKDKQWSNRYLAQAENQAEKSGAASFGFKVLSHNFEEWPFLSALLKQRGYHAIYLTRNIARQVLSGMVANKSGIWNTRKDIQNLSSYFIDPEEFQRNIEWELQAIDMDHARLRAEGFRFIDVTYEEFCTDRQLFYEKIFQFLELPVAVPPRSDYSVIIKDLRSIVANYDDVIERATALGVPLDFTQRKDDVEH